MSIQTIWWNRVNVAWDHGLLNEVFSKHPETFIQHDTPTPDLFDRAIVIVVGNPDTEPLRSYLNTLKSGVVILTSDETASWDIQALVPDHLEVWSQYYTAGMNVKERLLMGCPDRIKDYKINSTQEKKYNWSFIGQVNNPFRQQCVEVLRGLPDGFLQEVELFGGNGENGMEYQEYLDILCQSKYVICPAGRNTAETFRLYEAMECGAIPITDARSPRDAKEFNYWSEVYPMHKVISVNFWDEKAMKVILNMPNDNNWWFQYKKDLEQKLLNVANG